MVQSRAEWGVLSQRGEVAIWGVCCSQKRKGNCLISGNYDGRATKQMQSEKQKKLNAKWWIQKLLFEPVMTSLMVAFTKGWLEQMEQCYQLLLTVVLWLMEFQKKLLTAAAGRELSNFTPLRGFSSSLRLLSSFLSLKNLVSERTRPIFVYIESK